MPKLSWGHIFYLTPPPFLSSPHPSTIPLNMSFVLYWDFTSSSRGLGWIHFYVYMLPYIIYIVPTIWIMWSHMATFASYVSIILCQAFTWVLFESMLMHEYILWLNNHLVEPHTSIAIYIHLCLFSSIPYEEST